MRRKGEYRKSVELYLHVLKDLSKKQIITAIYVNANIKFCDLSIKSEPIKKFDYIVT
jgi:hypothetical protein